MLLSPKILASIKNLPLLAKTVIDGFMIGAHKSYRKGAGMEFSQYRSYQPGDDLRQLDWKLFARSDRYYIRESETETSVAVRFIVDASASMNHSDEGITKIDYARYLTASLAYLANSMGDATGLYVLSQQELITLAARQEPQHLQRLFYQLTRMQAGGSFAGNNIIEPVFSNSRRKEMVIVITDMYEQAQEIYKLIARLKAYRNEVIVFHIMGQNEMQLNYKGNTSFEDWETGQTVEVAPDEIRSYYTEALQAYLARIRQQMLELNIEYQLLLLTEPLDQGLRRFLTHRIR